MRIWDINPGYLNRQSLLGEHRELHGIVSILQNHKKGYSHHPETVRWVGYGWALKQRHKLLAAEMSLRGFIDQSPVLMRANHGRWPETYIDNPFEQLKILESKYRNKEQGRIPLPKNAQQLWSQHKYSVLARGTGIYREIEREVSKMKPRRDFSDLAMALTETLRKPPTVGGIRIAFKQMWECVSDDPAAHRVKGEAWSMSRLLGEIQQRAPASKKPYLASSTALSELKAWTCLRFS